MINSKKKGNHFENMLANWLHDNGIKAWKDGASGGGNREKGDIGNNLDLTIEGKAAKTIKLMEWWRQVSKSASLQRNKPILFIHQDGMPDRQWLVVMASDDWLETITGGKIVEPEPAGNRELKWALDKATRANKELLKLLEK